MKIVIMVERNNRRPLRVRLDSAALFTVVLVAKRNDRRILRWQGVLALVLVYLAIAAPIFFGIAYLLSHTVPDVAGILTFFVFPLVLFVGGCVRRAMATPLDQLPLWS